MFKNLASDLMGFSDIGKIIDAKDFDKAEIDEYVFSEDGEKIYLIIKSKTDEYCFTNKALMHLDGKAATSKKRTLHRYLYKHYPISQVLLETAGTIDLDAEIKFHLGTKEFSIDIDKQQIAKIRDLYKALVTIAERCKEIDKYIGTLQHTANAINAMFVLRELPEQVVLNLPDILTQTLSQVEGHYNLRRSEIQNYDFGSIFERYLTS